MRKGKAFLVTTIMSCMLGVILVGLYRLHFLQALNWIMLILAAYGFLNASAGFYRWLSNEAPMSPITYEEGLHEDL